MKRTRGNHGAEFKAQVAVAVLKGDKTLTELTEHFGVDSTQITDLKHHFLIRASDVFGGTKPKADEPDLKRLHPRSGN